MGKETNIWVQEADITPKKMNPRRSSPRHIIIKITKSNDKEKFKRNQKIVAYKANPKRLSAEFSAETLHHKRVS